MADSISDPRKANTLDEASRNPDGTYNGARALSWLSDVVTGGKGLSEAEVQGIFEDVKARKARGEATRRTTWSERVARLTPKAG